MVALAGSQLQLLKMHIDSFIFTCKLCRHNILMHFPSVLLSPSSILPALSLTDVSLHGYPPYYTGYSGTQTLRSRLHHLSTVSLRVHHLLPTTWDVQQSHSRSAQSGTLWLRRLLCITFLSHHLLLHKMTICYKSFLVITPS